MPKQHPPSRTHTEHTTQRRASKVYAVPVRSMRTPEVGVSQRRFSLAQAKAYAKDFDIEKFGIPVMNHRNGVFWVLDGQHRIAALKMWYEPDDPGNVDCEVYEGLTDQEMADIFLGRDNRRKINVFEKFQVACTAEYARELDIRRTVESNSLKVSKARETACVGAVSALTKVYDRSGASVLGQVLRVLRDAYASDPAAFDCQLIVGLGLVFNRFNGRTQEKELVDRLSRVQHGYRGVLQRAESQRQRTGNQKEQCVAAAIVDIYNRSANGRNKLPSWWKLDPDESADA